MNEQLWTANDLAQYLNVGVSTIRYWVHMGYIPHMKFRGAVRFFPPTIRDWIETYANNPITFMSEEGSSRITKKDRMEVT